MYNIRIVWGSLREDEVIKGADGYGDAIPGVFCINYSNGSRYISWDLILEVRIEDVE